MKKIIIGFVCGLVLVLAVIIAVLTTMFVPNKNDWLKVEITHDIRFRVDSWEKIAGHTMYVIREDGLIREIEAPAFRKNGGTFDIRALAKTYKPND